MTDRELLSRRFVNQNLLNSQFDSAADLVSWLGAVQSQDFYGGKWALGLRLKNSSDAKIEQAYNEAKFLRTHVLRPTWHFVSPLDIRWMLKLTAPRILAAMASEHRQLGLDISIVRRSNNALAKALGDNKHLTRIEIAEALKRAKINTDGQRFIHLMMRAELDAVICSGPRTGKQFTYALLNDRAPKAKSLERDESLAELSLRYFKSHGPATANDFAWWSGMTITEAKEGIGMNRSNLLCEVIDGITYWFADSIPFRKKSLRSAYLLPNYDEYIIAYADRRNLFDERHSKKTSRGNVIFNHTIILNGRVVGTWQRMFKKDKVIVETQCYVVGLNRVGNDGNGIHHTGESSVIDPRGEILWREANREVTHTCTLSYHHLNHIRESLPFLKDADQFELKV